MKEIKIFFESVFTVFTLFGRSKRYLVFVITIFFIVALLDMVGISLIGPYVVVFFDYAKLISDYPVLSNYSQQGLIALSSLMLISIFLVRAGSLWVIQSYILRISFNRQIELRRMIITSFLSQDYASRVSKTTSQYQTALMAYCQNFVQSLINSFRLLVEITSVILILTLLMITNFTFFVISALFAVIGLLAMTRIFSKDFVKWGENKNKGLNELVTSMNDVLTGIKEVKILGIGRVFENKVLEGAKLVASAERRLYLHSIIPRYILELLLVIIVCTLLAVSFFLGTELLETLSTLSIFLVAAMRLLPSLNLIITCINGISLNIDGVRSLKSELDDMNIQPNLQKEAKSNPFINFSNIQINNLSFNYNDEKKIFNSIFLDINRGDFMGIAGASGSGKTTLIDLIMGLNKPTSGQILVDNVDIHNDLISWRKQLAYLPQEIFLIDGTILENICIGHEINETARTRAEAICEEVGLKTLLQSFSTGIDTKIGEKGLKFSGGQRQRIALARAFYNDKKIIFLDESTSALDHDSSDRVITTISQLCKRGLTALLITHNQNLLKLCTRVIEVDGEKILESNKK